MVFTRSTNKLDYFNISILGSDGHKPVEICNFTVRSEIVKGDQTYYISERGYRYMFPRGFIYHKQTVTINNVETEINIRVNDTHDWVEIDGNACLPWDSVFSCVFHDNVVNV